MKLTKIYRTGILVSATIFMFLAVMVNYSMASAQYHTRYKDDLQAIQSSRNSLKSTLDFIDVHPEVFLPSEVDGIIQPLEHERRIIVQQTWQAFLDHILFFDSLGMMYSEIYDDAKGKVNKEKPFLAAFACFLAQYRFALDYIDRFEKHPSMHVILNEAVPELGLEEGIYSLVKYRFLNVIRGAEFARLNVLYLYYKNYAQSTLQETMEEDMEKIWAAGRGKGPALTAQNAMKIVGDFGFTTWFPVQKGVSELMGNIKVWRPNISLITPEQVEQLTDLLQPGDILLQRREWYASNIGIPGFWTHAALYIGTPDERALFFHDPALSNWFTDQGSQDGTLDNLLLVHYPDHYQLSIKPQEAEHIPRVMEAIGEGVSFTTIEHSASADSIVALRPNLPKKNIAQAIIKAFHYSGRPYDFNFDFRTDSELVCSELIFKAYQTTEQKKGLSLPLSEVLGRPLVSPNDIARMFDKEYGMESEQLAFVAFLDGNEKEHKAVESDVEKFRKSWKRPKWYIWRQNMKPETSSPVSP